MEELNVARNEAAAVITSPGKPPAEGASDGPQKPVSGMWITLFALAYVGFWVAVLTPGIIAIPLKITTLVSPDEAPAALGVVAAAGTFVGMVTTPIFGRLSDRTTSRFGMRRPWLIIGSLIGVLAGLVSGFAGSVTVLAIGYSLAAIGFNCAFAALIAVVADQVPTHQRGRVSGLVGITLPVALVGGTFVVQFIASDPVLPLVIPAVFGAFMIILFALPLRDRRLAREDRPTASWKDLALTFWVNPRRHPDFAWAFAQRFIFIFAYACLTTYQTFYLLNKLGTPPSEVAGQVFLGVVALSVTTVISSIVCGRLSDAVGRRKPFIIGAALIYAVALTIVSNANDFTGFLVGMVVGGFGFGAYVAVDLALATEVLPNQANAAKDLGVFNMASTLPQSLVPAVAPLILALGGGSYGFLFTVAAAIAALSVLAIIPVKSVR
ncbi:MFS transporter [Paenarthrobacter sp. NPDC056912]|uniref:MFS transporter n=1 Tax=Paenarthrobacter sp. NPDC056912 TaxID=3345965 RepID=UPI00366E1E37